MSWTDGWWSLEVMDGWIGWFPNYVFGYLVEYPVACWTNRQQRYEVSSLSPRTLISNQYEYCFETG